VLIFSLMVTFLCCYTVYIIQQDRRDISQNVFVTLIQKDSRALKRPVLKPHHHHTVKNMGTIVEIIPEDIENDKLETVASNHYPIAPKLDARV
jgi:hypothetical protein